jgi:pyridoxine kinase
VAAGRGGYPHLTGRAMNILSIQSHVAYGHVGNSAAVPVLQRVGCEVWPVHTVQFSNHPGYGQWRGRVFEADMIREIVAGIAERGVFPVCDGVLSGYLGSAAIGDAVLAAVASVKAANANARYCCDPVIGDIEGGIYVRSEVAEFTRQRMVAAADIVTPNRFELEYVTGRSAATRAAALAAVAAVLALGPRAVLVTSLETQETPQHSIDLLACDASGRFLLRTPKLGLSVHGAGDAIAALFFVHYLRTASASAALSRAASCVFGLLQRTASANAKEILVVEAQEELVNPSRIFRAEPI